MHAQACAHTHNHTATYTHIHWLVLLNVWSANQPRPPWWGGYSIMQRCLGRADNGGSLGKEEGKGTLECGPWGTQVEGIPPHTSFSDIHFCLLWPFTKLYKELVFWVIWAFTSPCVKDHQVVKLLFLFLWITNSCSFGNGPLFNSGHLL